MSKAQPTAATSALPTRRRRTTAQRDDPPEAETGLSRPSYDISAINARLARIRSGVDRITGLLVTTRDGLMLCGDMKGIEQDSVAAMSAAAVGLATQFTTRAGIGMSRAALFEGEQGYVAVFPVVDHILLVVFGERDITMGLFNVAARQALIQVQQAIATDS